MKLALLDQILVARAQKRALVLVTDLDSGAQDLIDPFGTADRAVTIAARAAAQQDRSTVFEDGSRRLFLTVFNPPLRLIIVGAVHIGQMLSRLAANCGYHVTICDPRGAFATAERFPDMDLETAWPDSALTALAPDRRTAVVTLTHDPKLDDPALAIALKAPVFYIGALGSKKTHAARLGRLAAQGFTTDHLARIHGPVGLDIGAKSPAEIALSIMAEITACLRRPDPS